jgi:hypothetical protein
MAIKANKKSNYLATDLFLGISNERIAQPDFFPLADCLAAGIVGQQRAVGMSGAVGTASRAHY